MDHGSEPDPAPVAKQRGFLVWGEPWRTSSWEMSEGYVEKWGWMLKGCHELLRSTNRYREQRGEDRLVVELEWTGEMCELLGEGREEGRGGGWVELC